MLNVKPVVHHVTGRLEMGKHTVWCNTHNHEISTGYFGTRSTDEEMFSERMV